MRVLFLAEPGNEHGLRGARSRPRPPGRPPDPRAEALALRPWVEASTGTATTPTPSTRWRRAAGTRRRLPRLRPEQVDLAADALPERPASTSSSARSPPTTSRARLPFTEDSPLTNPFRSTRASRSRRGADETGGPRALAADHDRAALLHLRPDLDPLGLRRPGLHGRGPDAPGLSVVRYGDGTALWGMTHSSDFAVGLVGSSGARGARRGLHVTTDEVFTWDAIYETIARRPASRRTSSTCRARSSPPSCRTAGRASSATRPTAASSTTRRCDGSSRSSSRGYVRGGRLPDRSPGSTKGHGAGSSSQVANGLIEGCSRPGGRASEGLPAGGPR